MFLKNTFSETWKFLQKRYQSCVYKDNKSDIFIWQFEKETRIFKNTLKIPSQVKIMKGFFFLSCKFFLIIKLEFCGQNEVLRLGNTDSWFWNAFYPVHVCKTFCRLDVSSFVPSQNLLILTFSYFWIFKTLCPDFVLHFYLFMMKKVLQKWLEENAIYCRSVIFASYFNNSCWCNHMWENT